MHLCPSTRQEMSAALVAQGLNDKRYIWDREVTGYVQVRVNSLLIVEGHAGMALLRTCVC